MKLYKQINNIKIYSLNTGGWTTKSPQGKFLEEFAMRSEVENWCERTLDFVKRKKNNLYATYQHLQTQPKTA